MVPAAFTLQSANGFPTRVVRIGGVPRAELLSRLQGAGVLLNDAARALFADARFTTSAVSALVETVQVSVAALGFPSGATFAKVVERAVTNGLLLCPLELGPHLRLQLTEQPEGSLGQPASKNCAPPGSVTVASAPLAEDDQVPKGFYLRRIEGDLWLRGYQSWPGHHWSPQDVFVFVRRHNVA
jgi:hypothetical protein